MPRGWANPKHPLHKQASGMPAGGQFWDNVSAGPARAYSQQYQPDPSHVSVGMMEAKEYREAVRAKLAMKLEVYDRATSAEAPIMAQLKAIEMMENRVYGQAKQIIETQEDSRTDDEIAADIERRKRELGV